MIDWKLWHSIEYFLEVIALTWLKKKIMVLKWALYRSYDTCSIFILTTIYLYTSLSYIVIDPIHYITNIRDHIESVIYDNDMYKWLFRTSQLSGRMLTSSIFRHKLRHNLRGWRMICAPYISGTLMSLTCIYEACLIQQLDEYLPLPLK